MRQADASAGVSEETLVRRAGMRAAVAATRMLGFPYGKRVVVVAGKGNNGADGRVAAAVLRGRGARVAVVEPGAAVPGCDLVLDAAFGTGFHGRYDARHPDAPTRVLAVDIPSGVDGDTGEAPGSPLPATRTVTFGALKPGLLQGEGSRLSGAVEVADIGLGELGSRISLVEDRDAARVPARVRDAHKWSAAVCVVAGSPGMEGAAALCARGASRAGAGMVRLGSPGPARTAPAVTLPSEAVRMDLSQPEWAVPVLATLERCKALVIGPGLPLDEDAAVQIRRTVAEASVPVVVDASALVALGDLSRARSLIAGDRPVVITPHDGEVRGLTGAVPGDDRIQAARLLSAGTQAVALVKGALTAVGCPDGQVLLCSAGAPALATAGTGDVLSGMIGAFLARGMPAPEAAAVAAHVHGRAASLGRPEGLVAGDLPDLVSIWLSGAARG